MKTNHASESPPVRLKVCRGRPARGPSLRATHSATILLAGCAVAGLLTMAGSETKAASSNGRAPKKYVFNEFLGAPPAPAQPVVAQATPPPSAVAPPEAALHSKPAPAVNAPSESTTAGKTLFEFKADNQELKTALAAFARANDLNIVPDNDVTGTVTLDVRNLPLGQMMRALLDASDCSWHEEGGLIRVRNAETRTFSVDYLRLTRNGQGRNSATLSSSSSGSGGGSGGGGSGGGGGGRRRWGRGRFGRRRQYRQFFRGCYGQQPD